ncbi:uncharacterized protein LOC135080424 isoform X2 [Ostrinia nubilalis]|uniref:uncharacterized protein LOC135080424 isoform X1 n=1 Tax=Ostrinia nubilalis TaxID=29057 RepID=UPI0030824B53
MEARLTLVLRCCPSEPALLAAALPARVHPVLLLLLYTKVPAIQQLLWSSESRRPAWCGVGSALGDAPGVRAAAAACTSATDRVAHTLLTALAHQPHHGKEHAHKSVETYVKPGP